MTFALLQNLEGMEKGCNRIDNSTNHGKPGSSTVKQIVLKIEYDGTRYAGFQLQKTVPTIQGELEKALKKLTGEFIRVYGSSRTDSGVHALEQVVSFKTESGIETHKFPGGLNYYLPQDISVTEAVLVNPGFDVRRRAISREYHYRILNRDERSPIRRDFYSQVKGELDLDSMNSACSYLIGKHDFASFASLTEPLGSTWRRVERAEFVCKDDIITFVIVANAFLPHQIRNMVGALTRVGKGQMTLEAFKGIMEARTPGLAQPTAPAKGLVLNRVNYSKELKEENLE